MARLSRGFFYQEYSVDGPRYEVLSALRKAVTAWEWEVVEERPDTLFCLADPRRRLRPRKRVVLVVSESGLGTSLQVAVWGGDQWDYGSTAGEGQRLLDTAPYPKRHSSDAVKPGWVRVRTAALAASWVVYGIVAAAWVFWMLHYDKDPQSWQTPVFLGALFAVMSSVQLADDFALRRTFDISSRRGLARSLLVQYGFVVIYLVLLWAVFWRGWGRF